LPRARANRAPSFGSLALTFDDDGNVTSLTEPSALTTLTWDKARKAATEGSAPVEARGSASCRA
jgi:YD repeat-containing protein